MKCSKLTELPPPPEGKTGWPWTEESEQLPDTMLDSSTGHRAGGEPWPKISIVTPSYNQGQFIEETIRSVLLQGYPNLEYIIIDGGSDDGSVEIIRKYEPWLAYWVSEEDRGQTFATNKGLRRAQGEIVGWLNSDDVYTSGTLWKAAEFFQEYSEKDVVYGNCYFVNSEGVRILSDFIAEPFHLKRLIYSNFIPQPSAFVRPAALESVNYLDERYVSCMDYDLWLRLAASGYRFGYCPNLWSAYRLHEASKTVDRSWESKHEKTVVLERFFDRDCLDGTVQQHRSAALGQAHWDAAWTFWQTGEYEQAQQHAAAGFRLNPSYLASREFVVFVLGHTWGEAPDLETVQGFLDALPEGVPPRTRRQVGRLAEARWHALASLQMEGTPQEIARHARRACWLNPHLLRRDEILRVVLSGNAVASFLGDILLGIKGVLRTLREWTRPESGARTKA